jgi:predicted DNA-binding transcriptional regulator AlpA
MLIILEEVMQEATQEKRTGRPKGAKDKKPRGRIRAERATHLFAEWLDAKEVGMRYGISPGRVRIWEQQGKLPPRYKLGENTVRWKRAELDEWDNKRKPIKYGRRAS